MYINRPTITSTGAYSDELKKIRQKIETAEAIVIGAGAGISASAGLTYTGKRFESHFSDFREVYGITDMYSGGFYPYRSLEEYWAWWSRQIYLNRYDQPCSTPYLRLLDLLKDKLYFIITTNVDHQFQRSEFDKQRLFYTQGDYGLWQCSVPCHHSTYDNEAQIREMVAKQKNMRIPTALVPYCPFCGAPMTMNLRCDDTFVQDEGWYAAQARYEDFIRRYNSKQLLFMELGVGSNTPGIIKYPFWQMTAANPKANYVCINYGEAKCPREISDRSICLNFDITQVLSDLLQQGA